MTINLEIHTLHLPEPQKILDLAVNFFNTTPVYSLPPDSFTGPGVYALYYTGDFELYIPLSSYNKGVFTIPIYVGKAVNSGWRTARTKSGNDKALSKRLREHTSSIKKTTHLRIEDFFCRFIVMTEEEAGFIPAVEAELIRRYRPLWNSVVDGFGNHAAGGGRNNQAISEWDALHQGRSWASNLTGARRDSNTITEKVRQHLEELAVLPLDIQQEADAALDQDPQQ